MNVGKSDIKVNNESLVKVINKFLVTWTFGTIENHGCFFTN
jgi:hypothetical protein